jgi:hypothetical protein
MKRTNRSDSHSAKCSMILHMTIVSTIIIYVETFAHLVLIGEKLLPQY